MNKHRLLSVVRRPSEIHNPYWVLGSARYIKDLI
jgi:hypothetical protein